MTTKIKETYEGFLIWYDHKGYPCIWINKKEIKLHIYIWEKVNGNKPKGYNIHHKDFNKRNYLIENLELLTISDHRRIHAGWVKKDGLWIKKPCSKCQKILPLNKFYFIKARKIQSALCKQCHIETVKERNQRPENIEKIRTYKRNYFRKHYAKSR